MHILLMLILTIIAFWTVSQGHLVLQTTAGK